MLSDRVVAVIGAGPAGLFAARQLASHGCQVVIFNRDIKPGGLAEYGIYVDKHTLKEGLRVQFRKILTDPVVHYFGNLSVGNDGDFTLDQVRSLGFHAVLVAVGAQAEKRLGLPGEDLARVYYAKNVVYHYNHLPPYSTWDMPVGRKVLIVGAGNVMMDITHWLVDKCRVDQVTAIVRRGPAEVKFDRKELESVVACMDQVEFHAEIERVSPAMRSIGQDPGQSELFYKLALEKAVPHDSGSQLNIHFLAMPHGILGDSTTGVTGLEVEETTLALENNQVKALGTGRLKQIPADTIIFAIGDQIDNRLNLPMEKGKFASNPNPRWPVEGQSFEVFDPQNGLPVDGIFLAGWARQPSTGVVGIAKRDGTNAAEAINKYFDSLQERISLDMDQLLNQIHSRCDHPIDYSAIQSLEAVEQQIARERGLDEYKFDTNDEMLAAINSGK
jgi:ferredoxin/flavodoxin---NADP+ reductase